MRARVAGALAASLLAVGITASGGTAEAFACPVVAPDGTLTPAAVPGVNWPGCDLTGANFTGADLTIADLGGANLTGATFTGATLLATHLNGAILTSAVVGGVDLSSAGLVGITSSGLVGVPSALPSGWVLLSGHLIGQGARVQGASLPGANLSGLDLQDADFSHADLHGANLSGANLFGVMFTGTNLLGADLSGTTGTAATNFSGTTCPDGSNSDSHNQLSCFRALDTLAPTASMFLPANGYAPGPLVTPVWRSADSGSLVATVQVRYLVGPVGGGTTSAWITPPSWHFVRETTSTQLVGRLGQRYCFSVRATDHAGNTGTWSPAACLSTPVDDRSLARGSGWAKGTSAGWVSRTWTSTTRRGVALRTTSAVKVRQVGVIAWRCSTCGSVAVYVGSSKVGTLSLVSPTSGRALVLVRRLTSARTGVVRLVVTSSGRLVKIDALALSTG